MFKKEMLEPKQPPEYYEVLPEFNSAGRLCNYHTGYREGETESGLVRVMADEWERFNRLAGRQHEIADGLVMFNSELEPCTPAGAEPAPKPGRRQSKGEAK